MRRIEFTFLLGGIDGELLEEIFIHTTDQVFFYAKGFVRDLVDLIHELLDIWLSVIKDSSNKGNWPVLSVTTKMLIANSIPSFYLICLIYSVLQNIYFRNYIDSLLCLVTKTFCIGWYIMLHSIEAHLYLWQNNLMYPQFNKLYLQHLHCLEQFYPTFCNAIQ